MDIIDIILAKQLTSQGQVETYAAKAQAAAQKANEARSDADNAVQTVENAADEISAAREEAQDLLAEARETLQTAQQAAITLPEAYATTGQNTDGYMTQKAVTDALDQKADTTYINIQLQNKVDNSTLNNYATTKYVNEKIASIPSSGLPSGVSNLGIDNAGKIVVIGEDGKITSGELTEQEIIDALANGGSIDNGALGLVINYDNKNFERSSKAANLVAGTDFDSFSMYGGRMRCNVADDGTINAFYGDPSYTEDGSNGQVMLYQPKFYYQRAIILEGIDEQGRVIKKEQLSISSTKKSNFKLHPLFESNGEELDYVLLPVYEGNVYDVSKEAYITDNSSDIDFNNDKLSSIAGVVPLSGTDKQITVELLRQLATNRGEGWRLTNIESESALQMLSTIEYGNMNGQLNIGKGIVNIGNIGNAITGATALLGNRSGMADSTSYKNNDKITEETDIGALAVAYRGMENPWGHLWRLVDGITVKGDGNSFGGVPTVGSEPIDFKLPNMNYSYISAMGYGNSNLDWVYMPIKCDNSANSALPVGDSLWTTSSLAKETLVLIGGDYTGKDTNGLFDYSCDVLATAYIGRTNVRIMHIPVKGSVYDANILKWKQHFGG